MKHPLLKWFVTTLCVVLVLCLGLQRCQAPEVRGNPQFTLLEGCIVLVVLIVVGVVVIKGLLTMCHLIPPPDPTNPPPAMPTNPPPTSPYTNLTSCPYIYMGAVSNGTPVDLQVSEGGQFASALRFTVKDEGSNAVVLITDPQGNPISTNTIPVQSYQNNRWGNLSVTLPGPVKPMQLFRLLSH